MNENPRWRLHAPLPPTLPSLQTVGKEETFEITKKKKNFQDFFFTTLKMDPRKVKIINIASYHRIRGSQDATKELITVRSVDPQQWDYISS